MYPPEHFQRTDESNDSLFYSFPRLVVHIDQQAIEAVGQLFRDLIPPGVVVLDLMSSWRSHWPQGHPKKRMVGLGLNADEMADNPDLDKYIIHDLNREPILPFDDEAYDAVVLTVSAQYLTQPVGDLSAGEPGYENRRGIHCHFFQPHVPDQSGAHLAGVHGPGQDGSGDLLYGVSR